MAELIEGLRSFSSLESSAAPWGPVDCEALMGEVLEMLSSKIMDKKAEVSVGALPRVRGDQAMLRQLFQNLVDNAVMFSGDGPPLVVVGGRGGDGEATLWVRDRGIGIAAEDAPSLFKLFRRLHTREEFPGSGLGLALCKKIVERHGGRLWLESVPGQGSTFFFTLPSEVDHGDGNDDAIPAFHGSGGGRLAE
jgi:signal transduction histidine kinase